MILKKSGSFEKQTFDSPSFYCISILLLEKSILSEAMPMAEPKLGLLKTGKFARSCILRDPTIEATAKCKQALRLV